MNKNIFELMGAVGLIVGIIIMGVGIFGHLITIFMEVNSDIVLVVPIGFFIVFVSGIITFAFSEDVKGEQYET